jgi:hypothetical protein
MEEVIRLLNEKNICLKRFLELNENEMDLFAAGNFDNLDRFYSAREGILEMIKRVDEMIEVACLNFTESDADAVRDQVKKCMEKKDQIVKRILAQDLEILSFIDSAKSEVIKELAEVRTVRKAFSSYKSGIGSGNVDEEA